MASVVDVAMTLTDAMAATAMGTGTADTEMMSTRPEVAIEMGGVQP